MLVGLAGLLISLFLWERIGPGAWGWHRGGYPAAPGAPPAGTAVSRRDAARSSRRTRRHRRGRRPARHASVAQLPFRPTSRPSVSAAM